MKTSTVRIPITGKGTMTNVAREMHYERVTDIPDNRINAYVRRLVSKYGERKVLGMLRAQVTLRKNKPGKARNWFTRADRYCREKYKGQGWTPRAE